MEVAIDGKNPHPTMKPASLMMELLSLFTDPDDIILDPFCGSGTTGVAAIRLGRRFIGIEREPKWAELSRERIAAEASGSTLQAARAGQEPLFR
jgi:modification methylase